MAELRTEIRTASMLAWIDPRFFSGLTDATRSVLVEEETRAFWAARILDAFGRPLMRPLISGALGMFGRDPGSVLKMTPQTYWLTFRGCGEPSADVQPNGAVIHVLAMPPVFRTPSIASCYAGHALGAAEHVGLDATVETDLSQLSGRGDLHLHVRW